MRLAWFALLLLIGGAAHAANQIEIMGSSSGSAIVQPQATAGSAIKTSVPNAVVTNGILQTDGSASGNTSWTTTPTISGTNFTGIAASTAFTGTVPVANGGTGSATGFGAAGSLSTPYVVCTATFASHTGDTTETKIATCAIPGNTLGTNGYIRAYFYGTSDIASGGTFGMRWGPNNSTADTLCTSITPRAGNAIEAIVFGLGTTTTNVCQDSNNANNETFTQTSVNADTTGTTYVNATCTLPAGGNNCAGKQLTVVWYSAGGGT